MLETLDHKSVPSISVSLLDLLSKPNAHTCSNNAGPFTMASCQKDSSVMFDAYQMSYHK